MNNIKQQSTIITTLVGHKNLRTVTILDASNELCTTRMMIALFKARNGRIIEIPLLHLTTHRIFDEIATNDVQAYNAKGWTELFKFTDKTITLGNNCPSTQREVNRIVNELSKQVSK